MFPLLLQAMGYSAWANTRPGADASRGGLRREQRSEDALAERLPPTECPDTYRRSRGEPIVVGVSAPLTGPDEAEGIEDRDAVIVGVQRWKERNGSHIKGHEIEVRAEDDGCTEADITAQAAERLLRSPGLVGVVGPSCSAGAQRAIPVYAQPGIVVISGSATESALTASQPEGGFFFRTAYRNDFEGTLAGLFASVALQAEKVYLVDDGELYGVDLADAAQRAMLAGDLMATRERVRRGMVDFGELAAKISARTRTWWDLRGSTPRRRSSTAKPATRATRVSSAPWTPPPRCAELRRARGRCGGGRLLRRLLADAARRLRGRLPGRPRPQAGGVGFRGRGCGRRDHSAGRRRSGRRRAGRRLADSRPGRPARRRPRHGAGGRAVRVLCVRRER